MHRPLTIALACAIAAPAAAQNSLTLYGVADVGLQFVDSHIKGADSKFGVASGQQAGSRFGLMGSESLGGGTRVEFQIESGFSLDTGRFEQGGLDFSSSRTFDRLFGREARLGMASSWGSIDLGRFGTLGSGTGSVSMLNGLDPFANGFLDAGAQATQALASFRVDNAVAIKSPVISGAQFGAMYSFAASGPELAGGPRQNMTYWGFAGMYQQGPAWFGASYEVVGTRWSPSDETIMKLPVFKIGGNYDFGVVRPFVSYVRTQDWAQVGDLSQYFYAAASGLMPEAGHVFADEGASSNAYLIGVSAPMAGGVLRFSYQRLEVTERDSDLNGSGRERSGRDVIALGYDFALSKRTTLYGLGSYSKGRGWLGEKHADPTDPDDVALYSSFNRSVIQLGVKHLF